MPEYQQDPNGPLHYLEFGHGEPLLLLHGNGADAQLYMPLMAALSPHYRILAPDLPGHGFSRQVCPASIDAYLDLVEAFVRQHIQGPFKLLAHSLGALVSYHLMLRGLPVTAAVWMEPAIFEPRPLVKAALPLYARWHARTSHKRSEVKRFLYNLAWDAQQADPVRVVAFLEAYMRSCRQVQALWLRDYAQHLPWQYQQLHLPILCLRGEKETFISQATSALVPHLPQAELQVVPRSGHCLLNENNPFILLAVQGFFHVSQFLSSARS